MPFVGRCGYEIEETMFNVTNAKIAGFLPRWASFRGFTILFNNPG